jgi:GNAT superfamily N-acetyltransferase
MADRITFSRMYNFVRARQLEGTFPGDALTGVWPITSLRVARGWGMPLEATWPYNGDAAAWPPSEPPNVDALAMQHRLGQYQRVRTSAECKALLALFSLPVQVSLDITDEWYAAPGGRIPLPSPSAKVVGVHCVVLVGYDDNSAEFHFANSWGTSWGDSGFGYLPYRLFEQAVIEAWVMGNEGNNVPIEPSPGLNERGWAITEHGGGVFHCREFIGADGDRIAWAFAVERDGVLDVEELYVRPTYRRKGYGAVLARAVKKIASDPGHDVRFWISHADTGETNGEALEKLFHGVGLTIGESGVRWAALQASASLPRGVTPKTASRPRGPFISR